MKTNYTNLAISTFFSSVLTTENLLCICRAFYPLPLLFFFCRPCFLTSQLLSLSVSSLVCLSFCGTTKSQEVWSLEVGGIFPSFILAHTSYVSSPPVLSSPTIKCKRKDGSPCRSTNLSRSQ